MEVQNMFDLMWMIKNADSAFNTSMPSDECWDEFWFETTESKERVAEVCKKAFADVHIYVQYEREHVFTNYICENCDSRDMNNHKSSCATQQTSVSCHCGYHHDDEI
jgi:hypothetical protein